VTLFFYGAVEVLNDRPEVQNILLRIAEDLRWTLTVDVLQDEFGLARLFSLPVGYDKALLVFELKPDSGKRIDVYDLLYADYGSDVMRDYYRNVAHQMGISEWQQLDFGAIPEVDEAYKAQPADIPVIAFIKRLFAELPERDILLCFDQDFENNTNRVEIVGGEDTFLREAWRTIAFGYSWPNLQLTCMSILTT